MIKESGSGLRWFIGVIVFIVAVIVTSNWIANTQEKSIQADMNYFQQNRNELKKQLEHKYNMKFSDAQILELVCSRDLSNWRSCFNSSYRTPDLDYGSTVIRKANEDSVTVSLTGSPKTGPVLIEDAAYAKDFMHKRQMIQKKVQEEYKVTLTEEQTSELNCRIGSYGKRSYGSSCYTSDYNWYPGATFGFTTLTKNDGKKEKVGLLVGNEKKLLLISVEK